MSSSNTAGRSRQDFVYFETYQTRWNDNDQYSHINNAVYFNLIDSIVNSYLIKYCGSMPSISSIGGQQQLPEELPPIGLVVSSYCNYYSPLSFPETITLGLRVARIGRSSVSFVIGFFAEANLIDQAHGQGARAPADDLAKAVGGYTHVFVDRFQRRPIKEMDAKLRDGLQALLIRDGVTEKSLSKL